MTVIFNATQHTATSDQREAGVVDVYHTKKNQLSGLLTFNDIPDKAEMQDRAHRIATLLLGEMSGWTQQYGDLDDDIRNVMIGGAPFFMSTLETVLKEHGFAVFYAFSKRESVETVMEDGTVQKKNVFKHVGFVKA